jgi:glycosyltransferase involved in cell wall biosynthesis
MLSVVILTKNEADRVGRAIASVSFADEVVVIDSGSTDGTVGTARALGARVIETGWPGYVAQKNRGLAEARGDWVLSLDADEALDEEACASVQRAAREERATPLGYRLHRHERWLGHPLRHGHWRPRPHLRLVRRGHARWTGEDPHDRLLVDGPVSTLPGRILHEPYRDLAEHLSTIDAYTRLQARRGGPLDVTVRPVWHFLRGYVVHGGFLDGVPGLCVAALGSLHTLLKWSRGTWEPPA